MVLVLCILSDEALYCTKFHENILDGSEVTCTEGTPSIDGKLSSTCDSVVILRQLF